MKKTLALLFTLIFISSQSFCKNVDSTVAKTVAENFYSGNFSSGVNLKLAYSCKIEFFNPVARQTGENLYYVFNVNGGQGFIIVSGDDIVYPVLAYSSSENYNSNNVPPACRKWLEGYKNQIFVAKENHLTATPAIKEAWDVLKNGPLHPLNRGAVSPLLTTKWNQSPYYNNSCPYDSTAHERTVTGCTATAMAQIMKYWSYPTKGSGFHSYGSQHYGTLSANFSGTTYNWAAMPNVIAGDNAQIATLMYDCGVSANMDYNIASAGGSGAYVISADNPICAQTAYVTYFGYDAAKIKGLYRRNYTDVNWISLLKTELDNSRPIQYVGYGSGGGHTWVCDGYDDNNYFHMNWGWGGLANGNYLINALNPTALGIGGGLGDFNSNEEALIGIQPATGTGNSGSPDIILHTATNVLPTTIGFLKNFTVEFSIENIGTAVFKGKLGVAIFSLNGDLVKFVDTISVSTTLSPSQASAVLSRSYSNIFTAPGQCTLGILYKNMGQQWNLAGDRDFTNPLNITYSDPIADISLYATITPSPSTFVKGQPASVSTNFINNGSTTYYGVYSAALYNLTGLFAEQINALQETNGLPAGYSYGGHFPFNTDSIISPPGTYLLCMFESNKDSTHFIPVGGNGFYHNPVLITVVGKPLSPDIYEPDNTETIAYTLPLTWKGDSANAKTTGANIHIGSDYDYYKINLTAGYNYTIKATAYDSHYSSQLNLYTDDVTWSYKADSGWSAAYDNIMPGTITVNGGGTLNFVASSFFPGLTGTYLLDIRIFRTTASGVENMDYQTPMLSISPNPSSTFINPLLRGQNKQVKQINITDVTGRTIYTQTGFNNNFITPINVSGFANGLYLMEAVLDKQTLTARFVVNH